MTEATITTTARELRRALMRTVLFADTSLSRPVLHGVHVRIDQQGARFAASDGHALAFQRLADAEIEGAGDVIIDLAAVKALIKALPKGKRDADEPVTMSWSDAGPVRTTVAGIVIESERIEGRPPNYDALVPGIEGGTEYTPGPRVAFDAALAERVFKAAAIDPVVAHEGGIVRFYVQEPESPMVGVTRDGFAFVFMPMYAEIDESPGEDASDIVGTPIA